MLSLFCSHLQFVIVSDQNIEKKMEILCLAGIFYSKHLKKWHGKNETKRGCYYIHTHILNKFISPR